MTDQSLPPSPAPSSPTPEPAADGAARSSRVVVVGQDGQPLGFASIGADGSDEGDGERSVAELVEQPAKVMRIGSMVKQLLEEVRTAPLDEASRARLRDIHRRSIAELESGLAPELVAELERLSLPFTEEQVPSDGELRIAQAQLVGWLEGLFHGIQTALFAQQMTARAQFEEMRRRALPGGHPGPPGSPSDGPTDPIGGGLYL
ncbi:MAG: bacterial proteasome activator family protein [Candidatus Nanopelagicales bacterium]